MKTTPIKEIKLFYCYVYEDKALQRELEQHLAALHARGLITVWNERDVLSERDWKKATDTRLMTSDLILLLISPSFLNSGYCFGVEMQQILGWHKEGKVHVIAVILYSANWVGTPVSELQILPTGGKPISEWPNRDEAWFDVIGGIREVVKALLQSNSH